VLPGSTGTTIYVKQVTTTTTTVVITAVVVVVVVAVPSLLTHFNHSLGMTADMTEPCPPAHEPQSMYSR